MSGLFDPAGRCRCASCVERRGYVEQAEVWQARAEKAEARVAELEATIVRAAGYLRSDFPRTALQLLDAANA